jgi:Dyp-type peroxidase family
VSQESTIPRLPVAVTPADLPEIQALVFRGWAKEYRYAAYLFVVLPPEVEAARAWLRAVEAEIAGAAHGAGRALLSERGGHDAKLPLALSTKGLRRLGLTDAAIRRFPFEAKVGMERRARVLGDAVDAATEVPLDPSRIDDLPYLDVDKPQPCDWQLDLRDADALVVLYARSPADLDALLEVQEERIVRDGGRVAACERSSEWKDREPFGFADGISQPIVRGQPRKDEPPPMDDHNWVNAGEILLGYRNEYGQDPISPRDVDGFDLGKNGTFLVFRKLEQHVTEFWTTFAKLGERHRGEAVKGGQVPESACQAAHWLAARAMGRWTNGNPVMVKPHAPGERLERAQINKFLYDDDPAGLHCPVGSHVRRANPRDQRGGTSEDSWTVVRRHRVLRRGRAFGGEAVSPEDAMRGVQPKQPTGLLFVCLQANISRGFEFVQQIWNNNPGFHGMFQEPDAITGPGGSRFTIPAEPVSLRLSHPDKPVDGAPVDDPGKDPLGLPRFVTPRGGGYFFVPSRSTVARLARGA